MRRAYPRQPIASLHTESVPRFQQPTTFHAADLQAVGSDDGRLRPQRMEGGREISRTEHAYQSIKQRILTLQIRPGALLTETGLARELGISKTPVREALSLLRRDRLVDIVPRSGYRAAPVTLARVHELYAVRILLEVPAVGMAAASKRDHSELIALEGLLRQTYSPDDGESITRFLRVNTLFHVTIARAGGNVLLAEMVQQVVEEMERLLHVGLTFRPRAEAFVHEHEELLSAVIAGDVETAKRVAEQQIRTSQQAVLDALLSSPALMSASVS